MKTLKDVDEVINNIIYSRIHKFLHNSGYIIEDKNDSVHTYSNPYVDCWIKMFFSSKKQIFEVIIPEKHNPQLYCSIFSSDLNLYWLKGVMYTHNLFPDEESDEENLKFNN